MDQLIPSLATLVEGFRPCFRHEVFHTFQHLLVGWIVCPGPRTISEVWQATGRAARHHHDTAYSLFCSAVWDWDELGKILALPRDDRWQTMARAALRDDVYAVHAQLTAQVLRSTDADDSAPARIAEWEEDDSLVVARSAATLEDICSDETGDLARVSVGLRVIRGLLASS